MEFRDYFTHLISGVFSQDSISSGCKSVEYFKISIWSFHLNSLSDSRNPLQSRNSGILIHIWYIGLSDMILRAGKNPTWSNLEKDWGALRLISYDQWPRGIQEFHQYSGLILHSLHGVRLSASFNPRMHHHLKQIDISRPTPPLICTRFRYLLGGKIAETQTIELPYMSIYRFVPQNWCDPTCFENISI